LHLLSVRPFLMTSWQGDAREENHGPETFLPELSLLTDSHQWKERPALDIAVFGLGSVHPASMHFLAKQPYILPHATSVRRQNEQSEDLASVIFGLLKSLEAAAARTKEDYYHPLLECLNNFYLIPPLQEWQDSDSREDY